MGDKSEAPLPDWPTWYAATKNYGGTREEYDRLVGAPVQPVREAARALGETLGLLSVKLGSIHPEGYEPRPVPMTPQPTREQADAFLADLAELTKKHGLAVWSCGCCLSPWLEFVAQDERDGKYTYSYEGWELDDNESPIRSIQWEPCKE